MKRELGQAYGELGKSAFDLIESGEISHPQLEDVVAKIRGLNEKAAAGDSMPGTEGTEDEPQDSEEPPATPA